MPATKTRRIPIRGPDGKVHRYLTVPDRTDPAYQARTAELMDQWNAAVDEAARQSGLTRDELLRYLRDGEP